MCCGFCPGLWKMIQNTSVSLIFFVRILETGIVVGDVIVVGWYYKWDICPVCVSLSVEQESNVNVNDISYSYNTTNWLLFRFNNILKKFFSQEFIYFGKFVVCVSTAPQSSVNWIKIRPVMYSEGVRGLDPLQLLWSLMFNVSLVCFSGFS